jgi:pyruvate ferredoxin oxidoreductase beta subunit
MMEEYFASGHTACAGCGMPIVFRHALEVLGKDVIVVNATSCSEIVSSAYPRSAWGVPYIQSLFENAAAIAAGAVASLRSQGNNHTKVIVFAGDGSTYDIGFGVLSGMLERNDDVFYICYDNEAYMNTGNQRSGSTPFGAATMTSQAGKVRHGKLQWKKPIAEIIAAHKIPYVATASIGYMADFENKVRKAKDMTGARFILTMAPCVTGWNYDSAKTIEVAKLAVDTGLWMLYEVEEGEFKLSLKPSQFKPVADYLNMQSRFRHLNENEIKSIQDHVNKTWNGVK